MLFFYIVEKPKLPSDYQQSTWKKLEESVIAIQKQKGIQYTLEELYQAVENMCAHNMSPLLYDNLGGKLYFHIMLKKLLHCTSYPLFFTSDYYLFKQS